MMITYYCYQLNLNVEQSEQINMASIEWSINFACHANLSSLFDLILYFLAYL